MRIAIFGATGAVGSTLLIHLLKGSDLVAGDEIFLVGRGTSPSTSKLLAMRTDLMDAFDAGIVKISVCRSLDLLEAIDIFIMAAGATVSEGVTERSQLATENISLFRGVAKLISEQSPKAFVLLISNPVELAVQVFCQYLDRKRVVGMGAQQDSLRFARAIATHLQLPRGAIRASVLGEHGEGMVPLWSSVYAVDEDEKTTQRLKSMNAKFANRKSSRALVSLRAEITRHVEEGETERAYLLLQTAPPDLKILVEPSLTVRLMGSTPNATANATLDCIAAIRHADGRKVHGQVLLNGEFCHVTGVVGAPLALRRSEWRIGTYLPLAAGEATQLREVSSRINILYSHLLRAEQTEHEMR